MIITNLLLPLGHISNSKVIHQMKLARVWLMQLLCKRRGRWRRNKQIGLPPMIEPLMHPLYVNVESITPDHHGVSRNDEL